MISSTQLALAVSKGKKIELESVLEFLRGVPPSFHALKHVEQRIQFYEREIKQIERDYEINRHENERVNSGISKSS